MIVLVIMAISLSLSTPRLRDVMARNQLLGQANEMAGALSLARSEAVTRGTRAGVCASANGTSCSGQVSDWENYILVFIDEDGGSDFDSGEPMLRSLSAHADVDQDASASAYFFHPSGFSTINSGSNIDLCHELAITDPQSMGITCQRVRTAPGGLVTVEKYIKSS